MIQVSIFADEVSRDDFKEAVDLSARAGARGIELRGGIWGRAVQTCTDDDVARIKAILPRYGAQVVAIGSPVGKCDIHDAEASATHMRWFERMCALAHTFETRIIRGFAFWNPVDRHDERAARPDLDALLPLMVERLSPIVARAEQEDVLFCLESEPTTCSGSCAEIARIIEALGGSPHLAVAWDVYNAAVLGEDPLEEGYPLIRGRVRHLHVKPNRCKSIQTVGDTQVSFEAVLCQLIADGYNGAATIEHWGSRWLMLEGARQLAELLTKVSPTQGAGGVDRYYPPSRDGHVRPPNVARPAPCGPQAAPNGARDFAQKQTRPMPSADVTFSVRDIIPPVQKHVHSSCVVELSDRSLIACWYHGSGERTADDVLVEGARLGPGASSWGEVFTMAETHGFPDCNPILYADLKGRLWLFWEVVLAHRWECGYIKWRRADSPCGDGPVQWTWQDLLQLDPGERFVQEIEAGFDQMKLGSGTWAGWAPSYRRMVVEAARDPHKRQIGWMPRIHAITLPSGRILLPLYSDGFNLSIVAISDDVGETWRASGPIVGKGPIQPTLVRRTDGSIVAYMRNSADSPRRVQMSVSIDDGDTWSPAVHIDIPNPDSSLEVIALADGRWLMVCNDTESGRHQLTAAISEDEGRTWPWWRRIEPCDDQGRSFGYPSVIQTADGLVHVTYTRAATTGNTIRHCVIGPEWLLQGG